METIEVRYNRLKVGAVFVGSVILIIVPPFVVFRNQKAQNPVSIGIFSVLSIYLIYSTYLLGRRFVRNKPVFVFSTDWLELPEKDKMYRWSQIKDWHIKVSDRDKEQRSVVIEGPDGPEAISLDSLDRDAFEVEMLFMQYKGPQKEVD